MGDKHDMWRAWFDAESIYQDAKWDSTRHAHDALMADEGIRGRWTNDVNMYLHRAGLIGLDKPNGRQALAKAAMVVVAAVESAVRVYGPLPEPGHTSGEIVEWDNAAK